MAKSQTPTEEQIRRATQRSARLRTPRAAAVAGILFSVLLITSLVLIRISTPSDPLVAGSWLSSNAGTIALALNLIPFAGIAFLWFIGVVRDRIGQHEDRLFATVFLGSGLLFLAMLFASAAVAGSVILLRKAEPLAEIAADIYIFGRTTAYEIMNIYAVRMAGVFMISTSTLGLRVGIMPRWMAFLGFALALILLLSIGTIDWISLVFPLWVLMISVYILIENMRGHVGATKTEPATESA
jgi:hypothetical protein